MSGGDRTLNRTNVQTSGRRDYQRSHPWIDFKLDLQKAPHTVWLDLGAIQSKFEHVGETMLPPGVAEQLHALYLAKGVHGTTAIEGNTLSESQVQDRIQQRGEQLPPSQEYQAREIDNIVEACNVIRQRIVNDGDCELTAARVQEYNRLVLDGLPLDEGVVPGEIRSHSVGVRGAGYRGAPAKDCEYLLSRLCDWLRELTPPDESSHTALVAIRAVVAHLYVAWIHPFGDGNGRTARLIEVHILLAANVPTIAAHLLSNHYNLTRQMYYRELVKTSRAGGSPIGFLRYALKGLREGLEEQIRTIHRFQRRVIWRDYVYWQFRLRTGEAARRRRALALSLGELDRDKRLVRVADLRRLTPELAELYGAKTSKTVTRDVNELLKMKLIQRKGRSVRDNRELLSSFLPGRLQLSRED